MNIKEMQDEIMRIKKEKDICILAHAYQSHDIWEVADYVGEQGFPQKYNNVWCAFYGRDCKTVITGKDSIPAGAGCRMPDGRPDRL